MQIVYIVWRDFYGAQFEVPQGYAKPAQNRRFDSRIMALSPDEVLTGVEW